MSSSRKEIRIVIGLIAIAAILSFAAYTYSSQVSSSILSSSIQLSNRNAQIQASDLNHILTNEIQDSISNIAEISNSSAVREQNVSAVTALLDLAQSSTLPFTQCYSWIDQTGNLLANSNQTLLEAFRQDHLNDSDRPYFTGARATGALYVSNAIVAPDPTNVTFVVVAQPIYSANHAFNGVIAVTLQMTILGAFIKSQLPSEFQSSFSSKNMGMMALVDPQGTVLYSSFNASLAGMNFTQAVAISFPTEETNASIQSVSRALDQGSPGVYNIPYQSFERTVAYQPITISDGSSGQNKTYLAMLFLSLNDAVAPAQAAQIAGIGDFAVATIAAIAAATIVSSLVFIRWNRRLDETVKLRTEELDRSNKDLKARDRAQRDFINTAAHELRTPVQPLLGMAELMRENMNDLGSKTIELSETELGLIERNVKRLSDLTKHILDVTRLENQSITLKKERFDLSQEAKNILEEIASNNQHHTSKHIDVGFLPSNEPLEVEGDRIRLGEVVSNLVNNAIRYAIKSEDSKVVLTAWKQGNDAYLRVRDSGPGIDPETMPKLFTKFFTKSDSGIGLGLYISKLIIGAHGGKIWAENNPDRGASFIFSVPLAGGGNKEVAEGKENSEAPANEREPS